MFPDHDASLSSNLKATSLFIKKNYQYFSQKNQHIGILSKTILFYWSLLYHIFIFDIARPFKSLVPFYFNHIKSPKKQIRMGLFFLSIFPFLLSAKLHAEPSRACAQLLSHSNRRLIWQTQ
jgi:hypothetical protein